MKVDNLPHVLSVEQAGMLLGISRRSAYRAANKGELPTLRMGRRLLVPTAQLMTLMGLKVDPGDVGPREV
jgi:excisionase family DNA binding protein